MKNTFLTSTLLVALLAISSTGIAQDPDHGSIPQEKMAEIKAQKSAYITTKLQLTPEMAQQFWPIYNAYDAENEVLRNAMREQFKQAREQGSSMTEAQANEHLAKTMANRQKELDLERQYNEKFKKSIGALKTVELQRAERDFNREVLRRLKDRIKGADGQGTKRPEY